jgi:hypothetical protein
MDNRLDHPELLNDFEGARPRRVRSWTWLLMALWLLLLAGDWTARFQRFQWHERWWRPSRVVFLSRKEASNVASVRGGWAPEQRGAGLTAMVPVPWVAAQYEEFHAAFYVPRDLHGYPNEDLPPGESPRVVLLGDSFMVSLGTQTVAQALAGISGVPPTTIRGRAGGPSGT